MKRSLLWVAAVLAAAGCSGGPRYAPASGVVLLDDVAYPDAVVSFQPVDTANPGRGSTSYTDANGRFVLKCDDGTDGAVVGKHLVKVMTKGNDVVGYDPSLGSADGDVKNPSKKKIDPIPPEWNAKSEVIIDIPAGGTDKIQLSIKSVAKGGAKKK